MASRTLPNLGLRAFYGSGEDGWGDERSEDILKTSVLVQGSVGSKVDTLPGSPSAGDMIICDETLTGHENEIAVYDDGAWVYYAPQPGWMVWNQAEAYYESFDGTVWAEFSSGGGASYPSFTGEAGKILAVNDAEDDVEWVSPITEGVTTGGIGAHKHWALFDMVSDVSIITIATIELRATAGGADLGATTATASSTFAGSSPANMLDADGATVWNSLEVYSANAYFEFDDPVSVREIAITAQNSANFVRSPKSFGVAYSDDGVHWFLIGKVETQTAYSAGSTQTFDVPQSLVTFAGVSGGIARPYMELIAEVEASGSPTELDTGTLPAGYDDLFVEVIARCGTSTATGGLRFNGDDGSNYKSIRYGYNDSGAASNTVQTTTHSRWIMASSSEPAGTFSQFSGYVYDYATTTRRKMFNSVGGSVQDILAMYGVEWSSTDAITSVQLAIPSGNFADGTVLRVYGVRRQPPHGQSSTVINDSTVSRTLANEDGGKYLRFTNAAAKDLVIDADATVGITANNEFHIRNVGAGDLTIDPNVAVTINLPAGGSLVLETGMTATLKWVDTDEFDLLGQTVAA